MSDELVSQASKSDLEDISSGEVLRPVEEYIEEGATFARFSDDTPYAVWYAYVRYLVSTEKAVMWRLGDSIVFGERKYEKYEQALDATDYGYDMLRKAVWVSRNVEVCKRLHTLSWFHHHEVAKLDPSEQQRWLALAAPKQDGDKPQMSARELRQAIKDDQKELRTKAAGVAEDDRGIPSAIEVRSGEWWRLGDHLLFCGDSGSREFKAKLPSSVPLAFADPPYNAGVAEWDRGFLWQHDYLADIADVVAVTPGIASIFDFAKVTKMAYEWSVAGFISNGMTRGAVGYGNWVYAALFSRKGVYRQAQDAVRFSIKTSETSATDHKGRKPSELVAYVVQTFSQEGDAVIDPFLGSGTTLFVCEVLGRRAYVAEIEPEYCASVLGRWQAQTGELPQRLV